VQVAQEIWQATQALLTSSLKKEDEHIETHDEICRNLFVEHFKQFVVKGPLHVRQVAWQDRH